MKVKLRNKFITYIYSPIYKYVLSADFVLGQCFVLRTERAGSLSKSARPGPPAQGRVPAVLR